MAGIESPKFFDRRNGELRENFRKLSDIYMELKLGKDGYPRLSFMKFDRYYFLEANIPGSGPRKETTRDIYPHELLIFAQIAHDKEPDSPLTKALIDKSMEILISKRYKLQIDSEIVGEAIRALSSL